SNSGQIEMNRALVLAPMEGVTNAPFRLICKETGADLLYSEFIPARSVATGTYKASQKMYLADEDHPIAIQIFGNDKQMMCEAAKRLEDFGADIIDLNFGCWVKQVVNNFAGAAFLKDPEKMAEFTAAVADSVNIPVTVKTRLGWDRDSIVIDKVAPMIEEAGAAALAVHCRTRDMAMQGSADWSYMRDVRKLIKIPLILNGDVRTPEEAEKAFTETGCDAVMIGRASIGNPFIFQSMRAYLDTGREPEELSKKQIIGFCLKHLQLSILYKGYPRGLYEFRKHYSGYLNRLHGGKEIRDKLVLIDDYDIIEKMLDEFLYLS
ncbi:MAG: tRNA dihydrouridine synthase DusB, partial [Candidatus Kapaibacterium sp.]